MVSEGVVDNFGAAGLKRPDHWTQGLPACSGLARGPCSWREWLHVRARQNAVMTGRIAGRGREDKLRATR
jgi:hypothetical protein